MPTSIRWMIVLGALLPTLVFADPPTIDNPAEPPAIESWTLREVWRLDNEENEDLPLMGVINQAVTGRDGHVFLLDRQMAQVLEISPEGQFLGTLSRRGQGPGELEEPVALFLTNEGMLGLVQVFPGKVVLVNRDGTPGGQITAQGWNPMFQHVRDAGEDLVAATQTMSFDEGAGGRRNDLQLIRLSRDGEKLRVYKQLVTHFQSDPPVMNEKGDWFPTRTWDLTADGLLVLAAERDEYRIQWLNPAGEIVRILTRALKPYVRTAEERQKVLDRMRMWRNGAEIEPKKTILDTDPMIHSIQVLRDGAIWVQTGYSKKNLPDGTYCRYDVYDAAGNLEAEVRIKHPVDPKKDYFTLMEDGRFLWFRNGRSVLNSMYAQIENNDEEDTAEDEDTGLQVILLERTD